MGQLPRTGAELHAVICLDQYQCPTNQQKASVSFTRQSESIAMWGTHVDTNGLFADNVEITVGNPRHDAFLRNVYFEGTSGTPPGTHGDFVHAQVRGEGFGTLYAEAATFRGAYTGFMMHEGNVVMRDVDIAQDQEMFINPSKCWPMTNLPNTQEIWRSFGDNRCRFGFAILAERGSVDLANVYISEGNIQGRASYPGVTRSRAERRPLQRAFGRLRPAAPQRSRWPGHAQRRGAG